MALGSLTFGLVLESELELELALEYEFELASASLPPLQVNQNPLALPFRHLYPTFFDAISLVSKRIQYRR